MVEFQRSGNDGPVAARSEPAVVAVLEGGPATLPVELRRQRVRPGADRVKIEHWGGHEHFDRRPEQSADAAFLFFDWVTRTRIAE